MSHSLRLAAAVTCALMVGACAKAPEKSAAIAPAEPPDAFVSRINREMAALAKEAGAAGFAYNTYVTPDTEFLNAKANERYLEYFTKAVEEAKAHEGEQLSATDARAINLLKLGVSAPAPKDPEKRGQLTALASKMEGAYASAKYCPKGPESCKDETALTERHGEQS